MSGLLPILALGFFLGVRHATDPDHVIAVTTIVSRHRSTWSAALIGAVWGVGHTLTIVIVGGGIILLGWVIPARVGLSLELSVALMLIVLGALTLAGVVRGAGEQVVADDHSPAQHHSHAHRHGDYVHTHAHGHDPERHPHRADETPLARLDRQLGSVGLYQLVRPLVVGVVHGLAGSAAVALLVLATISHPGWALLYLMIFGLGTIVGMMLVTLMVAWPFAYSADRLTRVNRGLRVAAGLVSIAFGVILTYRIGFVEGLFGG
jgi:ABC-type nickel/cobalt efflux system permease component RcnA